jgi:GrpB-like predicted nucleotidyltransferase (UPF0157 family)
MKGSPLSKDCPGARSDGRQSLKPSEQGFEETPFARRTRLRAGHDSSTRHIVTTPTASSVAPEQSVQASGDESDAPVEVVAYDDCWPSKFEAERSLLEAVLAPWLAGSIEHIGSTAVPLLPAKPVIDIMVPVKTLEASRPAIEAATSVGYVYYPYKAEVMHWFCKPSPHFRTHHLHLVPFGSSLWHQRLIFRDALRQSALLAAEYAELKLRLAAKFRLDREAYTEAKASFVGRVLSERNANRQNAA